MSCSEFLNVAWNDAIRPESLRFYVKTAIGVATIASAKYAEQGAAFLGKYLVKVISPETLVNGAKAFSTAAAGVGIYGAVGFIGTTLIIKELADVIIDNSVLSKWQPKDETLQSLRGAVIYLAGSGIAGGLVAGVLAVTRIYTAPTALAVVGTALSVHLAWKLFLDYTDVVKEITYQVFGGSLIGSALVAGKSLLGRVENLMGLTPSAAGLTFSVGTGLAALTLGIKCLAVKFFDTILARPPTEEYVAESKWSTGDPAYMAYERNNHLLRKARDLAVDVCGAATAAVGSYGIVRGLDLVAGPTAKLVIGATLITQMALKGIFKIADY